MLLSGLRRFIWWFQGSRVPRRMKGKVRYIVRLEEVTVTRDSDFARIEYKEGDSMECISSFREAHPELDGRFIDVKYHELVCDPLEVVGHIYQRLNMRLAETTAERIRRLAARRSRYNGRRSGPTLADLGIDETLDGQRVVA
jgi:hypothetical protein